MTEREILSLLRKRAEPVTMYLMNGFQIHGVIADTDDEMVLVKSEGKQMVVYRHAISTIVPVREIRLEAI